MEKQDGDQPQCVGLVAGAGEAPVYFARQSAQNGRRIVAIAFTGEIAARIKPYAEVCHVIGVGRSNKIFQVLKDEGVKDLLLLGKVEKDIVFKLQLFDTRAFKFLKRMVTHEDKSLLEGLIREVEMEGFSMLDQKQCMPELFPARGVLTRKKPSAQAQEDIEFGFPIARRMADMEIGQTIVVKGKTVVAVEAVEGTDKALARGCDLARGKAVAIKVSRGNQDYRYDVPGIGRQTVEALAQGKAAALAIEAERVMVMNLPEVIKAADGAGLALVAV